MKITFLLPVLGWSGGIRVISIYAKWLVEQGHEVTLVSQAAPRPSLRQRLRDLRSGRGWIPYNPHPASHIDRLQMHHVVVPAGQVPNGSHVPPADVLVSTWWETAEWAHQLPANCGARAYLVQAHETFDFLPRLRVEATYRLPFHKIVIAKWLADLMADRYADPATDLVPNAVDHALFNAGPRGKQSLPTVGTLFNETRLKGLDVALSALKQVAIQTPDLRIVAFGPEPPSGRQILPPNLELHIAPEQSALRNLYAKCDVWLSTSYSEGFNLMAMEAMACRTPVVSTRTGWPAEAVEDGANGYLVDVGDAREAAGAVTRILQLSETDWIKMSAASYATVATATWDASCIQFEQALCRARIRALKGEIAGVPCNA